jgi:regulatory protein
MPNKMENIIKIAIERLRNYCALQDKCQWDVIQKMQEWGLLEDSQNHILELLIEEKYVDEERYSRSFCRGKFRIKKWGKIKISNELKKKKISEVSINKGLEEISNFEYQEELDMQYHKKKKFIKEKNYFIKKKKIATYLINKGYESNVVWNKLKELKE